jgi:hypothetical protein
VPRRLALEGTHCEALRSIAPSLLCREAWCALQHVVLHPAHVSDALRMLCREAWRALRHVVLHPAHGSAVLRLLRQEA